MVQKTAALVAAAGRELVADKETAELARLKVACEADAASVARQCDVLVVFGGDGTILRVAREVGGLPTPLLGVNVGGLGFLTAVRAAELEQALEAMWAGRTVLETRPLIAAEADTGAPALRQVALNDFVVTRGNVSRLIELEVRVDDQLLTRYRCDGFIVSSPTGSTAYSLSAGGAIVSPAADVFTLTPICPHTLSNRSVVVPLSSAVRIRILSPNLDAIFTADGQVQYTLGTGQTVTIRRSRRTIRLMHLAGGTFFETLRRKLRWGGASL